MKKSLLLINTENSAIIPVGAYREIELWCTVIQNGYIFFLLENIMALT